MSKDAMQTFGLSKSRITAFEQCPRRLWLQIHRKDLAIIDDGGQARFDAGNLVGDIACSLYPAGIMVEAEPGLEAAIDTTRALVADGTHTIFEGTFAHDGVVVRIDIMEPDGHGAWHIAEVKSSTSVKAYHIGDLATQIWVMRQCGIPIASASIRHLNKKFILTQEADYEGLFQDADQSVAMQPIIASRATIVAEAREMLLREEPQCAPGAHCTNPLNCEFQSWCTRDVPAEPEWPISQLPRISASAAGKWAEQGITDIRDIPEDAAISPLHAKIRRAIMSASAEIDQQSIQKETQDWAYPRIWLDFETIAFPAPRWIGTSPWQQVAFQFSAHIEQEDGSIEHVEALDVSGADPRPTIAAALSQLPTEGAVIAWNAPFERSCLRMLAQAVPEHAEKLYDLEARTVDLLPIARSHYYHPNQRGSWSIKAVLPTIAPDLDYAALEVKDGGNAQAAYLEAIELDGDSARKEAIIHALQTYCALDTWAMIAVYRGMMNPQN